MRNALTLAMAAIFCLAALSGCATAKKKGCCPTTGSCCPTSGGGK